MLAQKIIYFSYYQQSVHLFSATAIVPKKFQNNKKELETPYLAYKIGHTLPLL